MCFARAYVLTPHLPCSPARLTNHAPFPPSAAACEPGTHEEGREYCQAVDADHVLPQPASNISNKLSCPANTAVLRPFESEHENARTEYFWQLSRGGRYMANCTCVEGTYDPSYPSHVDSSGTFNWTSPRLDVAANCRLCPSGARCAGGFHQPVAKKGYGKRVGFKRDGSVIFAKCLGCLEGFVTRDPSVYTTHMCDRGYANSSNLCSRCDSEIGYARLKKGCSRCSWGHGSISYLMISVLVVVVWFPAMRQLMVVHYKSFYVSFNFLRAPSGIQPRGIQPGGIQPGGI